MADIKALVKLIEALQKSVDAMTASLQASVDALNATVASMKEAIDHQNERHNSLEETVRKIDARITTTSSRWPTLGSPPMAYGQPPDFVIKPMVSNRPTQLFDSYWDSRAKAALEEATKHHEFEEKKKRVVLERMPLDIEPDPIVNAIVDNLSSDAKADFKKTFRHPDRAKNPTRIVKVEFKTEKSAREFMTKFRTLAPENIKRMKPMPFARRDMTPAELRLQFEMRKVLKSWLDEKKSKDDDNGMRLFYRDLKFYMVKSDSA